MENFQDKVNIQRWYQYGWLVLTDCPSWLAIPGGEGHTPINPPISSQSAPCLWQSRPIRVRVYWSYPRPGLQCTDPVPSRTTTQISKHWHFSLFRNSCITPVLAKLPQTLWPSISHPNIPKKGPVPCNIFQIPVKFCDQVSSSPPQLQCFGPGRATFGPVAVFWSGPGQIYVTYQRHRTVLLQPGHWSKRLCYTWLMESSWCDTSGIYW